MNFVILILLLILLIIDIIWSVYGFTTDIRSIREQRQLKVDERVRKVTKLNSMNSNTGVFPKIWEWEIKQPGDNILQQRVNELEKEVKILKNQIKNIETLCKKSENNYNVFATEKQAKSALAMARISQIMANDKRFGEVITDEEWNNPDIRKYCIDRFAGKRRIDVFDTTYHFLAFHTREQRDLFLEENEDLIKDYLMIN